MVNEESKLKDSNHDFKSYELLQNFRLKNHENQEAYLNNESQI